MKEKQHSQKQREFAGVCYTLLRSKRSRTMTITVRDGKVVVRAPSTLSQAKIEAFIGQKSAWIASKLAQWQQRNQELLPFSTMDAFYWHGTVLQLEFTTVKKPTPCEDVMQIPLRLKKEPLKLMRAVERFYKAYALDYLHQRMKMLASETGLCFRGFALSNARRKWGSCKSTGDIRLNWRLVLLDTSLSDYVMIHELCHTQHQDHSKHFWKLVEEFCPQYRVADKTLKKSGMVMGLYRNALG